MIKNYWLGLDIGSTTVKAVLVDPETLDIQYKKYLRHGARQRETAKNLLNEIFYTFGEISVIPVLCGSGSRSLAEELQVSYLQEVVANSLAVREFYPDTRVAIELGGQDAKITFFHKENGKLIASDMRMNGSCAGGTGAFLDEVATLLKLPIEELNNAAQKGKTVYDISGRCGVFAKTDIQPLLNQGVSREDLALSCFHAIAKQSIGGLAQGLEITPPVIFEGGPLCFNPELIEVYKERLGLNEEQVLVPENPEIMIALGAALAVPSLFKESEPHSLSLFKDHKAFIQSEVIQQKEEVIPFFTGRTARETFFKRHTLPEMPSLESRAHETLNVFLGIDAGSTTSKFVLINEEEELVYSFYGKNHGEPIEVLKKALLDLKSKADELNITLNILGAGTTGYGENLFNIAFNADYHTVETVAHSEAAQKYAPDVSFILDIGGQDMKAIFLDRGVVTGITLNEACSAGCGSFLENFAGTLGIEAKDIASRAFTSQSPSVLGSRCTVFMNSSVITEQKNGKTPEDIMAGLCNSVIENVFTKVIRLSNMDSLGENIVVQGGTFRNDAVLRSLELFTGKEVVRAPYPGEMGAIGIALLTKKHSKGLPSGFISWEDLKNLCYTQESGLICPYCSNNCNRTRIEFSGNKTFITGNRCEKGEILGDKKEAREQLKKLNNDSKYERDLFSLREELLFKEQNPPLLSPLKDITIGIPRVLEFWHSYPFWNTLFKALGFKTVLSSRSSVKLFESGLSSIASDTICFPAKLTHGHIKDLIEKKPDRIFMPMISRMVPESRFASSEHACAVLKGYPMVIQVSDEPFEKHNIPFDKPVFHWTCEKARKRSLVEFFKNTFSLPSSVVLKAIELADSAAEGFSLDLKKAGQELLDSLGKDEFAVVIAARPYHSDPLINHAVSDYFTRAGIAVLPADALPGINNTDLSPVRAELTINFHVRMFSAAQIVAQDPRLEYLQIVSFGCGHDAVISDEITRLLNKQAGKSPLILKMDESDVSGPLNIRIKSFIETVKSQRESRKSFFKEGLKPYETAYTKEHREKIILVPNVSWAFTQIATAAIRLQGYRVEPMPMAGENAIKLGKKYVHNDMCFPAQINIGEFLDVLERGVYNPDDVVLILAKDQCDCRLAHYAMMARQALDDAGYPQVAIATLDKDLKNMHPAFKLNPLFELRMLWGLIMCDALESLRRKIRPYELTQGSTDEAFEKAVLDISESFEKGIKNAFRAYKRAVEEFVKIPCDRSTRKPRVFMIGEFLLNFHPGSNNHIEKYLEDNGMEVIMPDLFATMHREFILEMDQKKEYHVRIPAVKHFITRMSEKLIRRVLKKVQSVACVHPFYEETPPLKEVAMRSQHIIDKTFTSGEGWLIAGEILHQADHGVNAFLILQPFGCLPNHVTGRGLVKQLKKEKPHIQILALDYDPDTSFANIENRLQMLIINTKEKEKLTSQTL